MAQKVVGTIIDAQTHEPLPLVNIVYNKAQRLGTTTNFEGYFEIPDYRKISAEVHISFIGYKELIVPKSKIPVNGKVWNIDLERHESALSEIDLVAGENPALRIVRNTIDNRRINNPKNYESYVYTSYNKDVITFNGVEVYDSLTTKDSVRAFKDNRAAHTRHLMVLESVTKKYFKAPDKSIEKVIGSKISGFKDPTMGTVPDGLQNFGFYDNNIYLMNEYFLNPISDQGDKRYIFLLKDTTFNGTDTTFIMDYLPKIGSNFDGFIGEIHINSNKWGIEYISAFPNDTGKVSLGLEQWYTLIDGKYWFPRQLNFNYVLERFPLRETGAIMAGKAFIDSVKINIPLNDSLFSHLEVDFIEGAGSKSVDFWDVHRAEQLDLKELQTYQYMDSLGERYNFDGIVYSTHNLYNGFLSFGKFDLQFNKFVAYNAYERLRLGLGIYTNKYLSKDFKIGGYFGYGTKDKNWKFGGTAKFYFKQDPDNNIEINYFNDLRPPGLLDVRYWKFFGGFREQFYSTIMDNYEEVSAFLNWRVYNYFETKVGLKNYVLSTNYDYLFLPLAEGEDPENVEYGFTESYAKVRWAYKEKFKNNFGQRISMGSDYPVLFLSWSHGFKGIGRGQFDYNKLEFGVQYNYFFTGWGESEITIEAGFIDQSVPYAVNFNSRPSYKPGASFYLPNTFQTMRVNEFTSSQYASLFYMHDFKALLFKAGYFKPELTVVQGISFGTLRNKENHQGLIYRTMEKGFFETGFVLDNIVRINTFNLGYIGIGAGAFLRYGPYRFIQRPQDNWAFKISFMYSVN